MPTNCTSPVPNPCVPATVSDPRILDCFTRRFNAATRGALIPPVTHTPNGDENLADKCGTYSKCILQDSPGKVNIAAFNQFRNATLTGDFSAFQNLILGGTRTENGPMGAYAYQFCGADGSQFGDSTVATPPSLGSDQYATELIELYWCSFSAMSPSLITT